MVDASPQLRAFFGATNAIAAILGASASALRIRLLTNMLLMLAEHLPLWSFTHVYRATCHTLWCMLGLHPTQMLILLVPSPVGWPPIAKLGRWCCGHVVLRCLGVALMSPCCMLPAPSLWCPPAVYSLWTLMPRCSCT
jgi:hypothetical protein